MKPLACSVNDEDAVPLAPILCCERKRKREDVDLGAVGVKRPYSSSNGRLVGLTGLSGRPSLKVEVQPEKYIRARYISEGCRGAMRGTSDNSYPTVKIDGYSGPAVVDVYLATATGEPHDNILVCGSNLSICREEVTLPGFIHAIRMRTSPDNNMKAVFDNLSIRRLRRFEVEETLRKRNVDPDAHHCDRTKGYLKFVATIQGQSGSDVKLSVLSDPLQCMTEPGAPEILFVSPNSGSPGGDYQISLVGKKFKSGFKVRFFAEHENEEWQVWANVNREISNQGAAVVIVPRFVEPHLLQPVTVNIEVKIGPEREPFVSEPAQFTFVPETRHVLCERCANFVQSPVPSHRASPSPGLSDMASPASQGSVYSRGDLETCPSPIDSLLGESLAGSPFVSGDTSPAGTDVDVCPSPIDSLLNESFDSATSPTDTGIYSDVSIEDLLSPFGTSLLSGCSSGDIRRQFFDFPVTDGMGEDFRTLLPMEDSAASAVISDTEAWKNIHRIVDELRNVATPSTAKILEFLDVLARNCDPSLLKIYQRCHATAEAIPGAQPSALMREELNSYLMAAVCR